MANYPPNLIYGTETPDLRFQLDGHRVFCRRNATLHLSDDDFDSGTFEAGRFLGNLCKTHCAPQRKWGEPCPAFVESHTLDARREDFWEDLATVKLLPEPEFDRCAGFRTLFDMRHTPEERFLLRCYYGMQARLASASRAQLRDAWNAAWHVAEAGWDSRVDVFDAGMWSTLTYPALIPQVWLNWLSATDRDTLLSENPSRVDFVAFAEGRSHAVEIDGPSHYATYDAVTRSYAVDEYEYARNLKIARSLERQRWHLTRVARIEVREAMSKAADESNLDLVVRQRQLLGVLPFLSSRSERTSSPTHPKWAAVLAAASSELAMA